LKQYFDALILVEMAAESTATEVADGHAKITPWSKITVLKNKQHCNDMSSVTNE